MTTNSQTDNMGVEGGTLGLMLYINTTGAKPKPAPQTPGLDNASVIESLGGTGADDNSAGKRNDFIC